jgi:glutathione S-transferase
MSLVLYQHPLASFCQKVLVALYENETSFRSVVVDFGNETSRAELFALYPLGKIPVLRDESVRRTVPETSIIIEYLDQNYPGRTPLLPRDEVLRLETRLWDRFFDLHVQEPMQRIVADRLRPAGEKASRGAAEARAALHRAYDMIEARMRGRGGWAVGDAFSMADCAAAPALFYAGIVEPFGSGHAAIAAYFDRLVDRPSFARTLAEARPYFHLFPFKDEIPRRFLSEATPTP